MITKRSSNEIQRGHDISTRGLDILCIAAELDELESSDESANRCTSVENSSSNNVNVVNQRNYKNPPRKLCSEEGCTSQSRRGGCTSQSRRGSDLCIKQHDRKRSKKSVCLFDGCGMNAQFQGLCRKHGGRKCSVTNCTNRIAYGGHGKCIEHAIIPTEYPLQTNSVKLTNK